MILLFIYFKRFFLNLKRLSDASVKSLTKKENGSAVRSLDPNKIFKENVW